MFILQFYIPTLDGILEELKGHVLEHMKAEEGATKEQGSTTSKQKKEVVTVGIGACRYPVFSEADLSPKFLLLYYIIIIFPRVSTTLFRFYSFIFSHKTH